MCLEAVENVHVDIFDGKVILTSPTDHYEHPLVPNLARDFITNSMKCKQYVRAPSENGGLGDSIFAISHLTKFRVQSR